MPLEMGSNAKVRFRISSEIHQTLIRTTLHRANTTQNNDAVNCRTIGTETIDIDLANACEGHSVIHTCPPVFFSVEHTQQTEVTSLRCTERECRFPDNARFAVVVENLGCFSGAGHILGSLTLLVVALASVLFRQ